MSPHPQRDHITAAGATSVTLYNHRITES